MFQVSNNLFNEMLLETMHTTKFQPLENFALYGIIADVCECQLEALCIANMGCLIKMKHLHIP